MKNIKKGFTLLESLIAIAVIGIVISVVLAYISSGTKVDPQSQVATGAPITEVTLPEVTGYTVDTAGVLTVSEVTDLDARLKAVDTSKVQIGVLILKTTAPLTIEEYSIKLAEKWKVGMKGLDNGAIIIIATQDRKVRLEVGYGLEGAIPDAVAGQIIRNDMGPFLHDNKWHDAVVAGIESIKTKIK